MIQNKDTLPFQSKMIVSNDTILKGKLVYIKRDTSFEDPCQVFEKIKGKIVNRIDSSCRRQGLWIFPDNFGNYSTSIYINGDNSGETRYYNKNGKLLKYIQESFFAKSHYVTTEIDYSGRKPITIINLPIVRFYINNFAVVVIIVTILTCIRIIGNNNIYNLENQTNYSAFGNRFGLKLNEPGEFNHRLLCTFTIWFFKYKPENRLAVITSNVLSIVCLASYLILTVGFGICER